MAMHLTFRAMTKKSHRLATRKTLQKPKRKFLPVILDRPVSLIDGTAFAQLPRITSAVLRPADLPG